MSILKILFFIFLFYLALKLVFNFIIPVYKTTRKLKKGFREMQERMNQHTEQYNRQTTTAQQVNEPTKTNSNDYIEFEEIK